MLRIQNHYSTRFASVAVLAASCAMLSGCGSNLAEVSGVVTLDGEPLRGGKNIHALVYFQPASGQGASAVGKLNENGVYRLSTGSQEGVAPGEYLVTLSATEIIGGDKPDSTPTGKRITDPKYASASTSGIRFVVQVGDNECDIPLESGGRKQLR